MPEYERIFFRGFVPIPEGVAVSLRIVLLRVIYY